MMPGETLFIESIFLKIFDQWKSVLSVQSVVRFTGG
jgi:hypothetical protein